MLVNVNAFYSSRLYRYTRNEILSVVREILIQMLLVLVVVEQCLLFCTLLFTKVPVVPPLPNPFTPSAIRSHSPAKPVLIFVSSRRQTRLTALDLMAFLATEDDPKQWLHQDEREVSRRRP